MMDISRVNPEQLMNYGGPYVAAAMIEGIYQGAHVQSVTPWSFVSQNLGPDQYTTMQYSPNVVYFMVFHSRNTNGGADTVLLGARGNKYSALSDGNSAGAIFDTMYGNVGDVAGGTNDSAIYCHGYKFQMDGAQTVPSPAPSPALSTLGFAIGVDFPDYLALPSPNLATNDFTQSHVLAFMLIDQAISGTYRLILHDTSHVSPDLNTGNVPISGRQLIGVRYPVANTATYNQLILQQLIGSSFTQIGIADFSGVGGFSYGTCPAGGPNYTGAPVIDFEFVGMGATAVSGTLAGATRTVLGAQTVTNNPAGTLTLLTSPFVITPNTALFMTDTAVSGSQADSGHDQGILINFGLSDGTTVHDMSVLYNSLFGHAYWTVIDIGG